MFGTQNYDISDSAGMKGQSTIEVLLVLSNAAGHLTHCGPSAAALMVPLWTVIVFIILIIRDSNQPERFYSLIPSVSDQPYSECNIPEHSLRSGLLQYYHTSYSLLMHLFIGSWSCNVSSDE